MTTWLFHNDSTSFALTALKDHGERRMCDQSCWLPFFSDCCLAAQTQISIHHHSETRSDVNIGLILSGVYEESEMQVRMLAVSLTVECSCTCIRILAETSIAGILQLGYASLYWYPDVGFWAHEVWRPVLPLRNEGGTEGEGHTYWWNDLSINRKSTILKMD